MATTASKRAKSNSSSSSGLVQTNLISMPMRVRKAIHDGYKNKPTEKPIIVEPHKNDSKETPTKASINNNKRNLSGDYKAGDIRNYFA